MKVKLNSNRVSNVLIGLILSVSGVLPSLAVTQNELLPELKLVTTAVSPEWREDWVQPSSTEQAPFFNHYIGTLCGEEDIGAQASVIEGIQRFKSKETSEQFRGLFGEGLSAMAMSSSLIWQGAAATAKTGEAAQTSLYGLGSAEQTAFELPLRAERPKIPKGSRTCKANVSIEEAKAILDSLQLWDGSVTKQFTLKPRPLSMLSGELPHLVKGVEWRLLLSGDFSETGLSFSVSKEDAIAKAIWDEVSLKLEPLGLNFDVKTTYVNEATSFRHRTWQLPDLRWISLSYQSGHQAGGSVIGESTILLNLIPALSL